MAKAPMKGKPPKGGSGGKKAGGKSGGKKC